MAEPKRPNEATPPPLAESLPESESSLSRVPAPGAARPRRPLPDAPNEEAQKHIREANLQRMRGQMAIAEKELQAAIALTPSDPEVYELLGDLQRQVGRTTDALASYTKAAETQSAPGRRATLESKMARLVLERDSAAIDQLGQSSLMQGNVFAVVALSALVPGLGQILSGQPLRGSIILVAWAATLALIVLLPQTRIVIDGLWQEIRGGPPAPMSDALKVLALLLVNMITWIFAMVDGAVSVRRVQEGGK